MDVHMEVDVDAPSTEAWQVLGEEFGEIADWTETLTDSSLDGELDVGATRTCAGTGFGPFPPGEVTEQLTRFDRDGLALSYEGTSGLPWFVTGAANAWSIESLGPDRCRIHSDATLELHRLARPFGAVLVRLMRPAMARFTDELKDRIESGPERDAGE